MVQVESGESLRAGFHRRRMILWQTTAALVLACAAGAGGRGSAVSLLCGAAFVSASFFLQDYAFSIALRRRRRTGLAVLLLIVKLSLILALAAIGLRRGLEPISFALGATTLLLAILIETWYGERLRPPRMRQPSA